MATKLHTATAQGAIEYLDSLVAKKRATAQVVSPLKTAVFKVLQQTEGEKWGQTLLIDLDVGDTMMRFKSLTLAQYTPGSYRNYEMRLKKAIEWYLKFLQTPGWVPPESARTSASARGQVNAEAAESVVTTSSANEWRRTGIHSQNSEDGPAAPALPYHPQLPTDDLVTYPFPLESGKMARLHIPKDITEGDVQRLQGFLDALVIRKEGNTSETHGEG